MTATPKTVALAYNGAEAEVTVEDVIFESGGPPREVPEDVAKALLERDDFKRATHKAAAAAEED
jgi:hypothetical protein